MLDTSLAWARRAPRYVVGWEPGVRGTLTGRRPDGFVRPLSTPAMARVPATPGKNDCTIAADSSAPRPSA